MQLDILKALNGARQSREAAVMVTNLQDGSERLVREGEVVDGALADEIDDRLRSGKSGTVEIGGNRVFLNVHLPPPRIVIIGAVHISQALCPIASLAGFDVTVIDPRTAFATPERFEGVELIADWPEDVLKERPLDRYTALAAVTHDPKIDDYALVSALRTGCFYVGALGSRKTHGKRVERLLSEGLSVEQIGQISAPIGLDIGASSPPEIAVSVLADIIGSFRRRGVVLSEAAA
ncbi:XdhC family protein [Rhizobium halophytocola]|uniref:Xanthine dehydrogenase accessory factor n=1 Tax=Rhizobium halophytocola TaxID=735519 RepID=A0ABS4DZE1_9HYPH|nr:XdhC family protein [Rhizobium halophytocola]MBP1851053.1 xanthine dehydrogenase accessory factor [Rhizobium halophytocola]